MSPQLSSPDTAFPTQECRVVLNIGSLAFPDVVAVVRDGMVLAVRGKFIRAEEPEHAGDCLHAKPVVGISNPAKVAEAFGILLGRTVEDALELDEGGCHYHLGESNGTYCPEIGVYSLEDVYEPPGAQIDSIVINQALNEGR